MKSLTLALHELPKAVLMARAVQTLFGCQSSPNLAKRLDCGRFTAAFPASPSKVVVHFHAVNLESVNGLDLSW